MISTTTFTPAFRNSQGDIITGFGRNTTSLTDAYEQVGALMANAPSGTANPVFVAVHDGLQWTPWEERHMAMAA